MFRSTRSDVGESLVVRGVYQGSVVSPILFNIFIDDLGDMTECSFSTFADDNNWKMWLMYQRDLEKVEKYAERNLMKFNKEKCIVLPVKMNNTMHQYMLGASQLESNSAKQELGALVDNKLTMNLGCIRKITSMLREVTLCLCTKSVKPHEESCVQIWAPH